MMKADTETGAQAPSTQATTTSDPVLSVHLVPAYNWRAHWLTATEFARMMGRRPRTIHDWIDDGTLAEFGIPVCRFRYGKMHSGRAFIRNVF